ncbi:hypothetical protein Ocin01_13442 [Orchesella cincta]|uniref:Uncharacterized protein n=1 Tax=Orchesella cincta TaxID=48709 RepID=A0A1D2MJY8_ORCCI|nr:hypothetical protein Ocin01_13442 [Orchesella cincta]
MLILGRKRVPTLLVWHNRPGMPEEITDEPSEKTLPPEHPPLPSILTNESEILPEPEQVLYLDFGTNTDPSPSPPPEKRERKSSNYFRIPETDIGKTEDWIYDMAEGTSGPEEIVNKNLVHDYQSVSNENVPDKFVNYGLMGSLQDTRVLDPASFIYKVSSKESIAVESAIEKDIRDAYGSVTFKVAESDTFSTTTTGVEIDEDYSEDIEQDNLQIRDAEGDTEKVLTVQDEATSLASGDFSRGANSISNGFEQEMIKSRRGSRVQVYWELSEMYYYQFGKILPRNWVVLAYTVCIAAIVAATVKLRGFEDTKIKERFQLYTVEGLTVLPDKYLLKFVLYLPQNWYPLPESSKDDNKTV